MGNYLNPGFQEFEEAVNSEIFVDKTEIILYLNSILKTQQKYVSVSRPRRFGKSITANMLCAYYGKPKASTKTEEWAGAFEAFRTSQNVDGAEIQ